MLIHIPFYLEAPLMAAEEKNSFFQYTSERKRFKQGLNDLPVDLEGAPGRVRRSSLRWALAGIILILLTARVAPFAVHKQFQGRWESFRPHRIPPKAAERIFL